MKIVTIKVLCDMPPSCRDRVQSYVKIVTFPKFHVHRIEPAISKNENPMSNS